MSADSPLSILYNSNGVELAVSASQVVSAAHPSVVVVGSASNGTWSHIRMGNDGSVFITGSIDVTPVAVQNVSMSNQPTVNQGNTNATAAQSWFVRLSDGTSTIGVEAAPVWVTGSVQTITPVTQSMFVGGWASNVTASVLEVGPIASVVSATIADNGLVGFTLLATNQNRKGATIYLDGNRTAFVKLGSGADTNSFTTKITNFGYYEIPYRYTGPITVTFNSSSKGATMLVTELS